MFGLSECHEHPSVHSQLTELGQIRADVHRVLRAAMHPPKTYMMSTHRRQAKLAPPVTKSGMPARCAISMVALTVVAPRPRPASTSARSRRDVLRTDCK